MKNRILNLSIQSDWTLIKEQDDIKMIQFQDGKKKMNIYWGPMTVYLPHENRTITDCSFAKLRELFGIRKEEVKKPNWFQRVILRK